MAVRDRGAQAFPFGSATVSSRHVRGGLGLVDENELAGIKIGLTRNPNLPFRGYVGALLFGGMRSLFLCVIRRRAKKRQIVAAETRLPE